MLGMVRSLILASLLAVTAWLPAQADGQMFVTGYTCDPANGQPYCGTTADGTQVAPGVAACPSWMAFGTELMVSRVEPNIWHVVPGDYVTSVRFVTCHDRGPDHIDIWFPTIEQCYAVTGWYSVDIILPSPAI